MSEFVCHEDECGMMHLNIPCEMVVRCKDCKFCMSYWQSDYCDYFSHVTNDPDGFCAWGERREVDE